MPVHNEYSNRSKVDKYKNKPYTENDRIFINKQRTKRELRVKCEERENNQFYFKIYFVDSRKKKEKNNKREKWMNNETFKANRER